MERAQQERKNKTRHREEKPPFFEQLLLLLSLLLQLLLIGGGLVYVLIKLPNCHKHSTLCTTRETGEKTQHTGKDLFQTALNTKVALLLQWLTVMTL